MQSGDRPTSAPGLDKVVASIHLRPVMAHGFRSAYGRLSPLTAPTALIGKVCNGSTPGLQSIQADAEYGSRTEGPQAGGL
jgi:hypothetical protein